MEHEGHDENVALRDRLLYARVRGHVRRRIDDREIIPSDDELAEGGKLGEVQEHLGDGAQRALGPADDAREVHGAALGIIGVDEVVAGHEAVELGTVVHDLADGGQKSVEVGIVASLFLAFFDELDELCDIDLLIDVDFVFFSCRF